MLLIHSTGIYSSLSATNSHTLSPQARFAMPAHGPAVMPVDESMKGCENREPYSADYPTCTPVQSYFWHTPTPSMINIQTPTVTPTSSARPVILGTLPTIRIAFYGICSLKIPEKRQQL